MKTVYCVKILGRLWMPMCPAAVEVMVGQRDIDFHDITDLTIEDYIRLHKCGDFSLVTDMEIERSNTTTHAVKDGYDESVRFCTVRAWESEESENTFYSCMDVGFDNG